MFIISKSNNIFDSNVKSVVYRDNINKLYGFIMHDNSVKLCKPYKSTEHDMYINNHIFNRIENIYFNGNDKRVKSLYEFILHCDNEYIIQYTNNDLLK